MGYTWHFSEVLSYPGLWLRGLVGTVVLAALAIIVGTALGLLLVWGLRARSALVRGAVRAWVDVFRAIPALVLLVTVYFCLPSLGGLRPGAFEAAVIALGINLAPFVAEVVRSGIDSVPNTQYNSAITLGFEGWNLWYHIIAPQALRRILPPLVGQYITTLKLTSLAAIIGVPEVWHAAGQIVTDTARPLEARVAAAGLYIAIILPLLVAVHGLERRFQVRGLGAGAER
jgi:polar amino acid transport system permease protein